MKQRDELTPIATVDAFVKAFANLPECWKLCEPARYGALCFRNKNAKGRRKLFCAVTAVVFQRTGKYFDMTDWRDAATEAKIDWTTALIVMNCNDNKRADPNFSAELRKMLLERFPEATVQP